jgi:hypothetical protein
VVYGLEGAGKTSLGCSAPRPLLVMTRGETGVLTLIDGGRVPETPHLPVIESFSELLDAIVMLANEQHDYKTLVIDTVNGAERLCHEHVCRRDFGGRWGRDGFTSYNTGYDSALADWRELLGALDRLREAKRMGILLLAHGKITTFKNPEGNDYDRYTPDLHPKTWGLTHKWADYVLFLNFETFVENGRTQRAKGKGGTRRVLYTERTAAFDAKNRHGLPERIDGGDSAAETWSNLAAAMKAAKPKTTGQLPPADVPPDGAGDPGSRENV